MRAIKNIKSLVIILLLVLLVFLLFLFVKKFDQKNLTVSAPVNNEATAEQVYLTNKKIDVEKNDNIIGDKNAALKIFVYEDVANIYSAELAATLNRLIDEYKNSLAIIVRPFITNNNLDSRQAALLIECAADQKKWFEMRGRLFLAVQQEALDLNNFNEYVKEVDLDEKALQNCLTSQEKYAKMDELVSSADSYGVIGAPTMFIGDDMIVGARPYDDYTDSSGEVVNGLKTIIENRLSR